MNLKELESILVDVDRLKCNGDYVGLAKQLKQKTIQIFRIEFPTDEELIEEVKSLNFAPIKYVNNGGEHESFSQFEMDRDKLHELLSERILFLKYNVVEGNGNNPTASTGRYFIFKDIGLTITLMLFCCGIGAGGVIFKYDVEKNDLHEKVKNQQMIIDSLRKASDKNELHGHS